MLKIFGIVISFFGTNGGLAQLGEHLPYKQAVIGSSPIVPTSILTAITCGEGSEYYIYAGMAQW